MDVKDDNKDVRLYRASGDLVPEILTKLPQLLRAEFGGQHDKVVRRWVLDSKVEELIYLVSEPRFLRTFSADRSSSAQPVSRMASATGSPSSRVDSAAGGLVSSLPPQLQGRVLVTSRMDSIWCFSDAPGRLQASLYPVQSSWSQGDHPLSEQ